MVFDVSEVHAVKVLPEIATRPATIKAQRKNASMEHTCGQLSPSSVPAATALSGKHMELKSPWYVEGGSALVVGVR